MSSRRVAQRRHVHGDDIQAIEEILTERSLCHHLRQIGVRGRDDADIDLHRVRFSDALEFPFLQHAEQLRLQRRAHRSDFVEEQRAAVRLLETSLPVADGSGERAPNVPEQLRLEQRLGDGAAVQRDEAVVPPRTVVMDGASRQLFAGACVPRNENRARRGRDRLEQLEKLAHRTAAPDDVREPVARFELRSQIRVLGFEAALLHRGSQHVHQRVELKGLGDEVGGAVLDRLHRILHGAVARDHDRDHLGVSLEGGVEDLPAVDAGEPEVGDEDVEREGGETLQGILAVAGLLDHESVIRQPLRDRLPKHSFVVDDQQMFWTVSHLVGAGGILTPRHRAVKLPATEV